MKTLRILVLILICFLLLPSVKMSADAIYETENKFYNLHKSRMVYLGRSFIANGKDGFASVREAPGAKGKSSRLQNGEETYIEYSCLYDGDYWGISDDDGWIQMDQLLVLYDYVSFEEDHFDELYLYKGNYEKIKETRSAIVWLWPGVVDYPLWLFDYSDTENFSVDYAYTDSQGREWGFKKDLHDYGDIWICLSDPLDSDIPAFNPAQEPRKWAPETRQTVTKTKQTDDNASENSTKQTDNNASVDTTKQIDSNASVDTTMYTDVNASGDSMPWLIVGLVAILVAGTAVLIRVFWKRNKKSVGGEHK